MAHACLPTEEDHSLLHSETLSSRMLAQHAPDSTGQFSVGPFLSTKNNKKRKCCLSFELSEASRVW